MLYQFMGSCFHNGVGSLHLLKSFAGSRGGFSKEPLEIVKGIKRVRSVGWAGLKVKKALFFLPIRWP